MKFPDKTFSNFNHSPKAINSLITQSACVYFDLLLHVKRMLTEIYAGNQYFIQFSRSTQDFQSTTTLKTWSLVALDRGLLYRGQMNGKTQGRNKLGRITQEVAKASLTICKMKMQEWTYSFHLYSKFTQILCEFTIDIITKNLPKSCVSSQSIVLGILPVSFCLSTIISCTLKKN